MLPRGGISTASLNGPSIMGELVMTGSTLVIFSGPAPRLLFSTCWAPILENGTNEYAANRLPHLRISRRVLTVKLIPHSHLSPCPTSIHNPESGISSFAPLPEFTFLSVVIQSLIRAASAIGRTVRSCDQGMVVPELRGKTRQIKR